MQERIRFPLDPVRDPKWLTEAGAQESAGQVKELVGSVLSDRKRFLDFMNAPYGPSIRSPLEASFSFGIKPICFARRAPALTEKCRQLLRDYPVETTIAAAVFSQEKVISPAGAGSELFLTEAWGLIQHTSPDPGQALQKLGWALNFMPSLRSFGTPQGRIDQLTKVIAPILQSPEPLERTILRVEQRKSPWPEQAGKNPYSVAVGLGLRELLASFLSS
jgi:hypothetical protein